MDLSRRVKDSEVDRLIKLYRNHPRRFLRMSESEMMAYATRRRFSSGRSSGDITGESTIGSRFKKFALWVILIILIIAFLASFSRK